MGKENSQKQLDQICLEALFPLCRMHESPEQDILDFAIEAGVQVTGSEIGYIYFVSEDETLIKLTAGPKKVMSHCSQKNYPMQYQILETGLWGEAVRKREPVITNNYADSPRNMGYLMDHIEDHIPIKRHMNLPVFDKGKIVMMAGVGNKKPEYTDEDVQRLSLIMDGTWNIIKRKRVESELKKINGNLEKIVKDRTSELLKLNEELKKNIQKQQEVEDALIINTFELEKNEEQLQIIMDNMPVLISYLDHNLHFKFVNAHYKDLFQLSYDDIVGRHVSEVVGETFFKKVTSKYKAVLKGEKQRFEMPISPAGQEYTFDISYIPHRHGNTVEGLFALAMDITKRKQMEKELKQLSITDPLTGATNRRFFMDMVTKEVKRCKRYGIPLSFMMIDIDYFKIINDSYGHKTGDEVLIALVKKSLAILRSTDIFSRVGGEEFASILIETDLEKARSTAQRLRKALEQVCVYYKKSKVQFTVSIGLTQLNKHDTMLEDMMKRADTALYMAKNKGRNRVVVI